MKNLSNAESFDQLDRAVQEDLIYWYNVKEENLDDNDKELLLNLYLHEGFKAWDCPECGERVCYGNPFDWSYFQGVNQPDHTSYPGNSKKYNADYLFLLCDDCRRTSV